MYSIRDNLFVGTQEVRLTTQTDRKPSKKRLEPSNLLILLSWHVAEFARDILFLLDVVFFFRRVFLSVSSIASEYIEVPPY